MACRTKNQIADRKSDQKLLHTQRVRNREAKSHFLQSICSSDLQMTLTLTFKVKVSSPHRDLSNKKKIIDLSLTVSKIYAFEVYTNFFEFFLNCGLGMTLTLTFKVKITSPHRDLSNKKKIIDLSHTVAEIYEFEVYTFYIGPILWHSKTLKAHNFLTAEDNLVKPYTFSLHSLRTII